MTWLSRLPAPVIYAISAALEKSFALLTIPLMAAYMSPADYGNFDVTVVAADLVVLLVGLGMAEQLIRFSSTAPNVAEEKRCAGEITGAALLIAVVATALVLVFAPTLQALLGLQVHIIALVAILIASCFSNLIELPLTWLRLQNNAQSFLNIVLCRTLLQVTGMAIALTNGYGAEGVLIANSIVLVGFSLYLLIQQHRDTPIALSRQRCAQIASYGAPVLAAMLAMYLLGGASRLFLAQSEPSEVVGHYGLAARFGLATVLLLYPLELWWLPKRIAVLREPNGLLQSAQVWGIAMAILTLSAMGVSLLAPVFVVAFLPATYAGAIALIPLLVITQSLHATAGLTEVGSYARETGYRIMFIDATAAVLAVLTFFLFIPDYGVYAAAGGVALGQCIRIVGYAVDGAHLAPIPYPWFSALVTIVAATLAVAYAPAAESIISRLGWTVGAVLLVGLVAGVCGLVRYSHLRSPATE